MMLQIPRSALSGIAISTTQKANKHNFAVGQYLIKVSKSGAIAHYFVDEVLSSRSIKIRLISANGSLSKQHEIISDDELKTLHDNFVANKISKKQSKNDKIT